MHELSLISSLLDIVEEHAVKHHFTKVNVLKLSFGRLSCIEPRALEFAFAVQSKGTRAEGATLEFDIHPAVISCLSCEEDFSIPSFPAVCPACGGSDCVLKGGSEELRLIEMDVD